MNYLHIKKVTHLFTTKSMFKGDYSVANYPFSLIGITPWTITQYFKWKIIKET